MYFKKSYRMYCLPGIFLILLCFKDAYLKLFTMELENFSPNTMRMPRSGASGNFTVLFNNGDSVQIEFCLRKSCDVVVRNIIYSNDGPADRIHALIDQESAGTFETTQFEGGGSGWNIFRSSGVLKNKMFLDVGRHVLTIKASISDQYGVEIDNVLLSIDDNFIEYDDILCKLYCFDVKYSDIPKSDSIPSGKFIQRSVPTRCSEQDNIRVEIFHDTITSFEISANIPKYVSFSNSREPLFENCGLASPYWIFKEVTLAFNSPDIRSDNAVLTFSGSVYKTLVKVTFNFDKLTPTREFDERLIGSIMSLKLRNLPRENVKVTPEFLKNGSWVTMQQETFTPFENEKIWQIPDGSWNIQAQNQVKLAVETGGQTVIIEQLKLSKRDAQDSTVDVYADDKVVFQGVRLGFWHHWTDHPESMTLYVQSMGTAEYFKIDSLRVYAKVPWTGGYAQVFVLFQDGRMRLQAVTPHGLDYIPFGPSINVGQPKVVNQERPYSPIDRIDIDPRGMTLVVRYVDGNKATFVLSFTYSKTTLTVKDAFFNKSRSQFPIMTFQSMWIQDGNSDTDHVTINGDDSRHISSDWKELYGISAVFFRKCISHHNTQGPDITIKFLSENDIQL